MSFSAMYRVSFYAMLVCATLVLSVDATDVSYSMAFPVVVAAAMGADLLLTGQQQSEEFPSSDNHIVNVVRDQLHLKEVVMDPVAFSVGVQWYFDRFGYKGFRPDVTPEMRKRGYVDVIVPGHDGGLAFATVGSRGGRPAVPPKAPEILQNLEYVSIWRVPLEPEPAR